MTYKVLSALMHIIKSAQSSLKSPTDKTLCFASNARIIIKKVDDISIIFHILSLKNI